MNPAYNGWYDDYAEYMSYKATLLESPNALDTYLMLLADKSYDVIFEINDPAIWHNE